MAGRGFPSPLVTYILENSADVIENAHLGPACMKLRQNGVNAPLDAYISRLNKGDFDKPHPSRMVLIPGSTQSLSIDVEIADIIQLLWSRGIVTSNSCQGGPSADSRGDGPTSTTNGYNSDRGYIQFPSKKYLIAAFILFPEIQSVVEDVDIVCADDIIILPRDEWLTADARDMRCAIRFYNRDIPTMMIAFGLATEAPTSQTHP